MSLVATITTWSSGRTADELPRIAQHGIPTWSDASKIHRRDQGKAWRPGLDLVMLACSDALQLAVFYVDLLEWSMADDH